MRRTCGGREGRRDEQALGEDADEVVGAAAVEEKHVVVDLAALQSLLLAVALHAEQRLHLARCSTPRTPSTYMYSSQQGSRLETTDESAN